LASDASSSESQTSLRCVTVQEGRMIETGGCGLPQARC